MFFSLNILNKKNKKNTGTVSKIPYPYIYLLVIKKLWLICSTITNTDYLSVFKNHYPYHENVKKSLFYFSNSQKQPKIKIVSSNTKKYQYIHHENLHPMIQFNLYPTISNHIFSITITL